MFALYKDYAEIFWVLNQVNRPIGWFIRALSVNTGEGTVFNMLV